MATSTAWLPYRSANVVMSVGFDNAAVFRLTLSAPASTAAAASASVRMPPPTASGMNSSRATARIVSASARRRSSVAVMSRMTSSSTPSALYRLASSAGSPARRSPSKLIPFTTWPSRTSRQAMMRFDSMNLSGEAQKIPEHLESHVAGFLWMELHACDVAALDDRRERLAMRRHGYRVAGDGRHEAVREVHLRAVGDAIDDGVLVLKVERVPSDMWDFYVGRRQPIASAA